MEYSEEMWWAATATEAGTNYPIYETAATKPELQMKLYGRANGLKSVQISRIPAPKTTEPNNKGKTMNIETLNLRLAEVTAIISEKGLQDARVQIEHNLDCDGLRFSGWIWFIASGARKCMNTTETTKDIEACLGNLIKIARGLKSPKEEARESFLAALGRTIDAGRAAGIEIEFLNPLEKSMRDLSENILTKEEL